MYCFIKNRECPYAGHMIYNGLNMFNETEGFHECSVCYKEGGIENCNNQIIKIMESNIKNLIEVNKLAKSLVDELQQDVAELQVTDEKTKVQLGNLCIMLHGARMILDSSQCLLNNDGVICHGNGKYYAEVKDDDDAPGDAAPQEHQDQNGGKDNDE